MSNFTEDQELPAEDFELAVSKHEAGDLAAAEQLYLAITRKKPEFMKAFYNLGVLYLQQGRASEAYRCARHALHLDPEHLGCWAAQIEAAIQTGAIAVASITLNRAITNFGEKEIWQSYAERLEGQAKLIQQLVQQEKLSDPAMEDIEAIEDAFSEEQYEWVEQAARLLTQCFPCHAFGWKALGVSLEGQQLQSSAIQALKKATELSPNDSEAFFNLANVLKEIGRKEEAIEAYRMAHSLDAENFNCQVNLAGLLYEDGDFSAAEDIYTDVLRNDPENIEAKNSLAAILIERGDLKSAEEVYLSGTGQPKGFRADINRALLRVLSEDPEGAAQYLESAFPDSNSLADRYSAFGAFLLENKKLDLAEKVLLKTVEIDDYCVSAWNSLGIVYRSKRKILEAENCYRKALDILPSSTAIAGNLASLIIDSGKRKEAHQLMLELINKNPEEHWLHSNYLFYKTHESASSPQELLGLHKAFGKKIQKKNKSLTSWSNDPDPDRTLRVGFVSADLCSHPVSLFLLPVLERINQDLFEIYFYSNSIFEDEMSDELRRYSKAWRRVRPLSDEQLFRKIIDDKIDILIDLSGHTAGNRLPVFARKPAPVQAGWIGYPCTTGLTQIDYFFVDKYIAPEGVVDEQFVEKLIRLPIVAGFQHTGNAKVSAPPAIFGEGFVFGSLNRFNKISDESINLWAQALKAVPESKILIGGIENEEIESIIIEKFSKSGIERSRLIFKPRLPFDEYMDLHNQIDLLLDTTPYTGGTTTNHALWMGVPTLTLAGQTLPGRQSAAILSHLGLFDFIAESEHEFVEKAVFWTKNLPELTVIRASLRSTIMDFEQVISEHVTQGLEKALREAWRRWCNQLPPISFSVE